MDKKIEFRFASLDEYGDIRIYNVRASTASEAFELLISLVEDATLEMASGATWYWNSDSYIKGCSTFFSSRGSWIQFCSSFKQRH